MRRRQDRGAGDINGDGLVNTFDISAFVDVMTHAGSLLEARRYEYDEENRLVAARDIEGNALLEIDYDALGRRIATRDWTYADNDSPFGTQLCFSAGRTAYRQPRIR